VTQIIGIRQVVILLTLAPVFLSLNSDSWKLKKPKLQGLRSCLALVGILAGFTSIINLPLAMATTIGFTRSFFVIIFAILILKETIGLRRSLAMGVGFAGVLIVAKPDQGLQFSQDVGLAVLAAASIALNMIVVRIQSRYERPTLMVAYQALLVGIALIIPTWYFWITPTWLELQLLGLIGVLSVFAQWAMVRGLKVGEAAAMAPLDYMRLLYAIFWGFLLFGEWPELNVWIGAGLIFASTLYIIHRDAVMKQKDRPSASKTDF
jgi:drug/metabolite transporter (DMT)-like permease